MKKNKFLNFLSLIILSSIAANNLNAEIIIFSACDNKKDGFLVSIRWGAIGTHDGNGSYGKPTGKECYIWGITQWEIKDNKIMKEWTVFNEFGILVQLMGDK